MRRQLARTPWLWRVGVVTAVADGRACLDCPPDTGLMSVRGLDVWHHRPLTGLLSCGGRVLVHQRSGAVDVSSTVLNVAITVPGGTVPVPVDLDTWADDAGAPVIPLR